VKVIKPGHAYQLEDGNMTKLVFRHHDPRLDITINGCRSCDILEAMIHRHAHLNQGDGYCMENIDILHGLYQALNAAKARHTRVTREREKKNAPEPDDITLIVHIHGRTLVAASAYAENRKDLWEKGEAPAEPRAAPAKPWPLGINPIMDRHIATFGLDHWSCTSPMGNDKWMRRDGMGALIPGFAIYTDVLRQLDKSIPMTGGAK